MYKTLSYINLFATPLAPAMLYASDVYRTLTDVQYPETLAVVIAGIAVLGIEGTGALTFHNATTAWRKQDWSKMALAVLFGTIYAAIMILGLILMELSNRSMVLLVLLTVGAYIGSAMFHSFIEDRAEQVEDGDMENRRLREKRLTINAQTRFVKARGTVPQNVPAVPLVQNDTLKITPQAQAVKDSLKSDPDLSVRKRAAKLNISETTVQKWVTHWRNNK
jgi:hypothetical protein